MQSMARGNKRKTSEKQAKNKQKTSENKRKEAKNKELTRSVYSQ
jgi:hypothetical protein